MMFKLKKKTWELRWIYVILILNLGLNMTHGRSLTPENDDDDYGPCVRGAQTTSIPFRGVAKGGELILAETLNRNMRVAVIQTQANESAESVANHLAEYINTNDPFEWQIPKGFQAVTAEKGILKCLLGSFILAGTETGLGIPLPPYSLTCSYDIEQKILMLFWENPPEVYDNIMIVYNWSNFDHRGGIELPGDLTAYAIDLNEQPLNINDLDIWVIGFRNGTPSNAAAIHVSGNGRVQEELFGIPFKNNVAPNWKLWVAGGAVQDRDFESLVRNNLIPAKGRRYNSVKSASRKPYCQIIKTPQQGGTAGIWRKFLGLSPGHTYRITARLNTLQMDPNNPNWSFSLHAAYDDPSGKNLTTQQFVGSAPLPNGSKGLDAGKISRYAGKITTEGKFVESSADITLPDNVTSLTVWLRHSGKGSGEVMFDWVKLEDITPAQ